MRDTFVKTLTSYAKENKRIIILSGDIGNRMFDEFKNINKKKFYNCGIAEANMISVASGLASDGFLPFVYTITPFITSRCLEQIKIGISYHNYPVTIVGTGSGLSYAELGPTHHSFDDVAILRALPNIRIFTPGDPNEVRDCIVEQLKNPKPTYIRLGKKGEPNLDFKNKFHNNKIRTLTKGGNILLLSLGNITHEASIACQLLSKNNYKISHSHVNCIKPFDKNFILKNSFKKIITLEEHSIYGGLSSTIAEIKSQYHLKFLHYSLGMGDKYLHKSTNQENARGFYKITKDNIISLVKKIYD